MVKVYCLNFELLTAWIDFCNKNEGFSMYLVYIWQNLNLNKKTIFVRGTIILELIT